MTTPRRPLLSRLMAVQYRVYDRMRSRRAFEVAGREGSAPDFTGFRGSHQCLLVTFKRSGEPVPSPVNFGLSGNATLYFRSEPHTSKVLRAGRNPHVRVGPCSLRGKPRGPMVEAIARVLDESEHERASTILAANWDPASRLLERTLDKVGVSFVYVEVTPAPGPGSDPAASDA
jgi:hypothetical protein